VRVNSFLLCANRTLVCIDRSLLRMNTCHVKELIGYQYKRDLLSHQRDVFTHKRDLLSHQRDVFTHKRDLFSPRQRDDRLSVSLSCV